MAACSSSGSDYAYLCPSMLKNWFFSLTIEIGDSHYFYSQLQHGAIYKKMIVSFYLKHAFGNPPMLSFEQDEFSGVITKALSTLVLGLENKLEAELANMARMSWGTLEGVGDQSEYVVHYIHILLCARVWTFLCRAYFHRQFWSCPKECFLILDVQICKWNQRDFVKQCSYYFWPAISALLSVFYG